MVSYLLTHIINTHTTWVEEKLLLSFYWLIFSYITFIYKYTHKSMYVYNSWLSKTCSSIYYRICVHSLDVHKSVTYICTHKILHITPKQIAYRFLEISHFWSTKLLTAKKQGLQSKIWVDQDTPRVNINL